MNELRYIEICDENHKDIAKKSPWRVTAIYFVVGCLWILFSDKIVSEVVSDQKLYESVQTVKGGFYIVVTSIGLHLLMKFDQQKLVKANKRLFENQEELLMYSEELISSEDELHRNLNELKNVTEVLTAQQLLNDEVFNHANTAIVIWRDNGETVKFNKRIVDLLGYDGDLRSKNIFDYILLSKKQPLQLIQDELNHKGEISNVETEMLTSDNKKLKMSWNISKMEQLQDDNQLYIGFGLDLTEVYEKDNELSRVKDVDMLTELWQKRVFYGDSKQWLSDKRQLTFFLIGIDNFSAMNNLYGQEHGDIYLKSVCADINALKDIKAYRWTGDEVLIVDEGICNESIISRVNVLHGLFGQERSIENIIYSSKASIGVLVQEGDYFTSEQITKRLHIALKKAKDLGKNQHIVFEEAYLLDIIYKNSLKESIQNMLRSDGFELYFQPIYHIIEDKIKGYEVLLRCNSQGKQINTGELIEYAERNGQIIEIDRWVIENACKLLGNNDYVFSELKREVSINISAQSFYLNGFDEFLESIIEKYNVNPAQINIEITEYSLLKNIHDSEKIFMKLKNMGFKMSLDDFGIEYSSLNYLSKLPFDTLKVDKSYIDNINENLRDRHIVKHLVSLAKDLKIDIVAEGIETSVQKELLIDFGCTYGQGYLLAKPQCFDIIIQNEK